MKSIRPINRSASVLWVTLTLILLGSVSSAVADDESKLSAAIELGSLWFSKNDIRIPGEGGTKFDMTDLTGSGPEAVGRFHFHWDINEKHALRVILAPLEVSDNGELAQDTVFAGETFLAGTTEGRYKFNTYRISYRYLFDDVGAWHWRTGFTAVIRDAKVELRQGALSAKDDNVGFVPSLHLSGRYQMNERLSFELDMDGLAGGPGRLFDGVAKIHFDLNDQWRIGGGYRTLEGGADTDDVFNFAWLHFAVLDLRYRF